MRFDEQILCSLKGDYLWNGIHTSILIPLTRLDLICIHKISYEELDSSLTRLINDHLIECRDNKYFPTI